MRGKPGINESWFTVLAPGKLVTSPQTSAQNNVLRLVKLGILREVTGRKRDRIFMAPEILHLRAPRIWANRLTVDQTAGGEVFQPLPELNT